MRFIARAEQGARRKLERRALELFDEVYGSEDPLTQEDAAREIAGGELRRELDAPVRASHRVLGRFAAVRARAIRAAEHRITVAAPSWVAPRDVDAPDDHHRLVDDLIRAPAAPPRSRVALAAA
jgi:hypothetical protein